MYKTLYSIKRTKVTHLENQRQLFRTFTIAEVGMVGKCRDGWFRGIIDGGEVRDKGGRQKKDARTWKLTPNSRVLAKKMLSIEE